MLKHIPTVSGYKLSGDLYGILCMPEKWRKKNQKKLRSMFDNENYSPQGCAAMNYLLGYTEDAGRGQYLIDDILRMIQEERNLRGG